MSDFKFACPGCGQRMAANDDYVGHQINCPSCHAAIVVPANPSAPAAPAAPSSIAIAAPPGMPPPPAPPKASRLGVSALSSPQAHAPSSAPSPDPEQQGSAVFKAHMARKPQKSYTGLITAIVAVALIGGSVLLNKDWISAKWKSWRAPSAAELAAIAATNTPPPPPELTASEIVQKVAEEYKGLPSFSSVGKATAIMDMSAVSPALAAAGPQTFSSDLTLKMTKPLSFRIDTSTPTFTSNTIVMGWSTGNGDFIQANNRRVKLASHAELFSRFNTAVSVGEIVLLFLDDANASLVKPDVEWTRNKDETLNGQPCYVLAGNVKLQNVLVWVNRQNFLIPQTQIVLDGKSGPAMDDAKIKAELKAEKNGKEPTLLEIATVKNMFKVKGSITETYGNIQTNVTFAMTDIQPPAPVVAAPMNGGAPGQGGSPGGAGRATGIAGGRRGR